mgnify:CR=1 FL=1
MRFTGLEHVEVETILRLRMTLENIDPAGVRGCLWTEGPDLMALLDPIPRNYRLWRLESTGPSGRSGIGDPEVEGD